ncbi:MAG: RHS repeat-associated core domain-containing protein [Symploca sp. SIO2C1]|nr:RHS repeat-associated core domain-containing protein [Symploca sp. SIO2C1]
MTNLSGAAPNTSINVPAVTGAQNGEFSVGKLHSGVSLYRGRPMFNVPLFQMTGPNSLQTSLQFLYQGVNTTEVRTWNMDSQAGIVGLGWLLPINRIALDTSKTNVSGESTYYLFDSGNAYRLLVNNSFSRVSYSTENYEFWSIEFNSEANQWIVKREDGTAYIYGGSSAGATANKLQWDNWSGATTISGGQSYTVAWHLVEIRDLWGNAIAFTYENDEVKIGGSTQSYTRSTRLAKITDPYGRQAEFLYADLSDSGTAIEVQPPHTDPSGNSDHAYQDRYETEYLEKIVVYEANPLSDDLVESFSILLSSSTYNFVNSNPYLYKRCLDKIELQYPGKDALLINSFTYQGASELLPGSLKKVVFPEGGSVNYTYATVELENCLASYRIGTRSGTPRVWFSENYVVVTFQDDDTETLQVSVLSWDGTWNEWPISTTFTAASTIENQEVLLADDFFLVYYNDQSSASATQTAYLFNRKVGGIEWEKNSYNLDRAVSAAAVGGGKYLVLQYAGNATHYVFNLQNGIWRQMYSFSGGSGTDSTIVSCGGTSFLVACRDSSLGTAQITAVTQSEDGSFFVTTVHTISNIYWDPDLKNIFWSGGQGFAAATYTSSDTATNYTVAVVDWFQSSGSPQWQQLREIDLENNNVSIATTASGNLIGNQQYVWRYTGKSWSEQNLGNIPTTSPSDAPTARLAYGDDIAVLGTATGSNTQYQVWKYQAYQGKWEQVNTINGAIKNSDGPNTPTLGTNYMTLDNQIYFRGADCDWNKVESGYMGNSINTKSILNLGPLFLLGENSAGNTTNLVLLRNGEAVSDAPTTLSGERCYVDSNDDGTTLSGSQSFVTYPSSKTFGEDTPLKIYRVLDADFTPNATYYSAKVVRGTTHDDGYQTYGITYDYNESKFNAETAVALGATYGVAGRIAQFTKVSSYEGVKPLTDDIVDSASAPYGRTTQYFINGVNPTSSNFYPQTNKFTNAINYYSSLGGSLLLKIDYDKNGAPVWSILYDLWLVTKKLALDTAYYSQVKRQVSLNNIGKLFGYTSSTSDISTLNNRKVPDDISEQLDTAKMSLSGTQSVIVVEKSSLWLLLDDDNDRKFIIVANEDELDIYVGLRTTVQSTYNPNNLLAKQITLNCTTGGEIETVGIIYKYLSDVNPTLSSEKHLLHAVVQTTQYRQIGDQATYTSGHATVWWPWKVNEEGMYVPAADNSDTSALWAPAMNFTWDGPEGGASSPDFINWSSLSTPDGWQFLSRTDARHSNGVNIQITSIDGIPTSYQYDSTNGRALVGKYHNVSALKQEYSYYGFEPYEVNPGWQSQSQESELEYYTNDAHIGSRCYSLKANNVLSTQFAPETAQVYLLSVWYKTSGSPASGTGFTVVTSDENTLATINLSDSGGEWKYIFTTIDLSSEAKTLTVNATNTSSNVVVLIDNISIRPFVSSSYTSVYHLPLWSNAGGFGTNGEVDRYLFDSSNSPIGQSSIGGSGIIHSHFWSTSTPSLSLPNNKMTISARTSGQVLPFYQDTWTEVWIPGTASNWTYSDSWVTLSSDSSDTLELAGTTSLSCYGASFEFQLPSTQSQKISWQLGKNIEILLKPDSSSSQWELLDGDGKSLASPVQNTYSGKIVCTIVVQDTIVAFFAAGQLIFSYVATDNVGGPLTLSAGDRGVGFSIPILCIDPLVNLTYINGVSNGIQNHRLKQNSALVNSLIYDERGLGSIVTKTIEVQLGDKQKPLALVENLATFDSNAGTVSGLVSDYYSGQTQPDGITPSNDEGYPFWRTEFEASPLMRPMSLGKPGKIFAITDQTSEHIQALSYLVNLDGDSWSSLGLSAGQFACKANQDADGTIRLTLSDKLNNQVASATANSDDISLVALEYDSAGNLSTSKPPAYFDTNTLEDLGDSDTYLNTAESDFYHRVSSLSLPDSSTTQCIYDPSGRVRFMQNARGQSEGYFCYWTYDRLRRMVEFGYISTSKQAWNTKTLQSYADNLEAFSGKADWPTSSDVETTWYGRMTYDGDGSQPYAIGRVQSITTNNNQSSEGDVIETHSYDEIGRLATKTISIDGNSQSVTFSYDGMSNTIAVVPSIGPAITYGYNTLGQLETIGTSEQANLYASYSYDAQGKVYQEKLNPSATSSTFTYQYNSPGWISSIGDDTTPFQQTFYYEKTADNSPGYYDGRIASISYGYNGSNAPEEMTDTFTTDYLSQILTVNSTNAAFDIGSNTPIAYDANGNIKSFEQGEQITTFTLETNRILSTSSTNTNFEYDTNGYITYAPTKKLKLSYDKTSLLPTNLTSDAGMSISFAYNAATGHRVKKNVADNGEATIFYLRDAAGQPLAVWSGQSAADGSSSATAYIQGPLGLVAVIDGDSTYFIVKDHLGSTRVVLDESANIVGGCDYLLFGGKGRTYGSIPAAIRYLYTGHEYDEETGLYNMIARFYDPDLYRFYTPDPAKQYPSPYIYVGNQPISLVDPTGSHSTWAVISRVICGFVGAIVVIGTTIAEAVVSGETGGAALIAEGGFQTIIGAGASMFQDAFLAYNQSVKEYWNTVGIDVGKGAAIGLLTYGFSKATEAGDLLLESKYQAYAKNTTKTIWGRRIGVLVVKSNLIGLSTASISMIGDPSSRTGEGFGFNFLGSFASVVTGEVIEGLFQSKSSPLSRERLLSHSGSLKEKWWKFKKRTSYGWLGFKLVLGGTLSGASSLGVADLELHLHSEHVTAYDLISAASQGFIVGLSVTMPSFSEREPGLLGRYQKEMRDLQRSMQGQKNYGSPSNNNPLDLM